MEESEREIDELWSSLELDGPTETRITMRVAEIKSYLASPSNYRLWNSKLQRKGIKHKIIVLNDIIVYTSSGRRLRILVNPVKESIRLGKLLIDTVIIATQVSRQKIQSLAETHSTLSYLYLHDWIYHPDPANVDKIFSSHLPPLQGYLSESCPNGNPTGSELCNWTYAGIDEPPQVHLQRFNSLRSVPSHVQRAYDPTQFNLRHIESHGVSQISLNSSKPPLCLRIVMKSKDRMIVRQEDGRKPVIGLTTLLVADSTGMCKLIIWDEAVLSFNNISEGDQILLAGRYNFKVGGNDKYLLEPKVRLSVPRVRVELKLNISDLRDVFVLDHAVNVGLPPPVWNFYTIGDLTQNKVPSGRIVDIIGLVVHHGRWERESCTEPNSNSLTGQFWIRVWIKLVDHTCIRNRESSQYYDDQKENFAWIKLYVDVEKYENIQTLLPQVPAVITNLLVVYSENNFSHLESSNETQVFVGDSAFSSRFLQTSIIEEQEQQKSKELQPVINVIKKNNLSIEEFRNSWNSEDSAWAEILDECTMGGNSIPLRQIKTMFSLSYHLEVYEFLQGLPYLTGARVMLSGRPLIIREYTLNFNGSIDLIEESVLHTQEMDENQEIPSVQDKPSLLEDEPCIFNATRHPLDVHSTSTATARYCFLSLEKNREAVDTMIVQQQVLMVLIEGRDFKIWLEAPIEFKQQLTSIQESNVKYCVDFYRFQGSKENNQSFDGMEGTLRRIYTPQQQQEVEQQHNIQQQANTSVGANQTMDFLSVFR